MTGTEFVIETLGDYAQQLKARVADLEHQVETLAASLDRMKRQPVSTQLSQ